MAFQTLFRIFVLIVVLTCVVEGRPYTHEHYINGRYVSYTDADIAAERDNTEIKVNIYYQFCGPGTKTFTRIARGERGINDLDKACLTHDLAYHHSTEYSRYLADQELLMKADGIMKSSDYSFLTRAHAYIVKAAMVGKLLANDNFDSSEYELGK